MTIYRASSSPGFLQKSNPRRLDVAFAGDSTCEAECGFSFWPSFMVDGGLDGMAGSAMLVVGEQTLKLSDVGLCMILYGRLHAHFVSGRVRQEGLAVQALNKQST